MASNQSSSAPPAAVSGAGSRPLANLGLYFSRGFEAWGLRWKDWLVPMLVAAAVTVAAMLCCYLPIVLVSGPLACGLTVCALRTLRAQPFDAGTLWCGWPAAGRSILAWIVVQLLIVAPMLLLYALSLAAFFVIIPILGSVEPQALPEEARETLPMLAIAMFVAWYVLMLLACFAVMAWSFWLNTRTMFVIPLIADREADFSTAWSLSWRETRKGFWELLLLQVVAGIIGMLGLYVCYVGLIVSLPIYFTMVAAAYEHRFAETPQLVESRDDPI